MVQSIIALENVSKIYQMGQVKVSALKDTTLDIKQGEFVAIAGPSGSGKSTMMNLVGCLDLPTNGKVFLDGHNLASFGESKLAQTRGEKIGFVFQQFNLIPTLTALENVMLPLAFQDMPDSFAKKKALELLSTVGLADRADHLPSQLSGGQMQRVAIARALSVDPEIILADEPTGNLDSKTGKFIMDLFGKIHREDGKTIIIITHDPNLVKYAERIIYLKDGSVDKITYNREKKTTKRGKK